MKDNYTHITVVLDRSGSMEQIRQATVDGFNEFVNGQKSVPGTATLSLIGFDDKYEVWKDFEPIEKVGPLDRFEPRGMTALWDSMARAINQTGETLASMSDDAKPSKVLVVTITDGLENQSKVHTAETLKSIITHQREQYQWEFVFIGANQDAVVTAAKINIPRQSAMTYEANPVAARATYAAMNASVKSARLAPLSARGRSLNFTDEQRRQAVKP